MDGFSGKPSRKRKNIRFNRRKNNRPCEGSIRETSRLDVGGLASWIYDGQVRNLRYFRIERAVTLGECHNNRRIRFSVSRCRIVSNGRTDSRLVGKGDSHIIDFLDDTRHIVA